MLNSDYDGQNCSIARALEQVGERWTLLIVRELLMRPRRFTSLQRRLGIAKNILSTRLDKLVDLEIAERIPYGDAGERYEYQLTRKGRELFPVINALLAWGDTYAAPEGAPLVFEHACGHPAGHKVVCAHCGKPLDLDHLEALPGPGFAPAGR
ncbi:winged helix-turn-helix transcriptional regulator [Mycolicibacterium sp.]|uniref:winged helix-turn-helix transcriptional regulator n=1 Tax=Mycolicibacterium sp. TaxID=2320850 RepID=UPI003D0A7575